MKTIMKTQKVVENAWRTLNDLADKDVNASQWLIRALQAAMQQEREHRATGKSFGGMYRWPVERTARWFVLKWVLNPPECPGSWSDWAGYREDVQWSAAVAAQLGSGVIRNTIGNDAIETILSIDYAKDIAK